MSKIEEVTRAIYLADDPTRGDPLCVTLHDSVFVSGDTVKEQLEEVRQICRSAAIEAIKALRDPTDDMRRAFRDAEDATDMGFRKAWNAAIERLLAEANP